MDLDIFVPDNSTKNFLPNSASTATIRMTSSGDVYAPFMVSTAIDVYEPDILLTKTFVNINGNNPANLGDTIEYTLKIVNRGNDPADSVIVTDSLYTAMNFVPGSMQVLTGPRGGYINATANITTNLRYEFKILSKSLCNRQSDGNCC